MIGVGGSHRSSLPAPPLDMNAHVDDVLCCRTNEHQGPVVSVLPLSGRTSACVSSSQTDLRIQCL